MTDRYTKKDAKRALDGLMQLLNKKHTKFDNSPGEIGSWYLDYNATYGGAIIHEVVSDGHGVRTIGRNRMKPYEFCQAIDFFYAVKNS